MAHVLPQVALHRVLWQGLQALKANPLILERIFEYYTISPMDRDYGAAYINNIKTWLQNTEIPVIQAWSLNPQIAPQIAIRLASEQEDESKAAMSDFWGTDSFGEVGTSPFVVNLDILIMTSRNSDECLWLYYIVSYILFTSKREAERLGLQLQTFSATDNIREMSKVTDNIWVRTIKFRCIVQNFWRSEEFRQIDGIESNITASDINNTQEVDL